jgi:hypothetical protein
MAAMGAKEGMRPVDSGANWTWATMGREQEVGLTSSYVL